MAKRTLCDPLEALGAMLDSKPEVMIETAARLLKVRDRNGRVRPLLANQAQQEFERRRGRENIVLKARQMGMTTWIAARFFLRTITMPGTSTLLVAHTREASENVFGIVRRMWEGLPEDLREGQLSLRRSNVSEMVFRETGSEFRVASAADLNAGRGLSVQQLHCSEVSRWPGDAAATLAGLRASLAPGGELVLESTPSGAYGAFYDAWREGVDGSGPQANGMTRHFFPWWMEAAYTGTEVLPEEMNGEERLLVERHGLSGAQIGFRRGLEKSFGMLRSQEFAEDAESCFRATGECCFETSAIEQRLQSAPAPLTRRRNGGLWIWFHAMPGRRYVMGVDTAGGNADGDFATVQIVDMETGMQCAELQERLRPSELVAACLELYEAYPGTLIAVERNNHGAAVLALLERERGVELYHQNGAAGWLTTAGTKPGAISKLGALLEQSPELFMSRRLLGECRTFLRGERGQTGAAQGEHDDLVMAMAITQAVRAEMLRSMR